MSDLESSSPELERQYLAMRRDCGVTVSDERCMIEVTGRDRQRYLHGLCTAEVKSLEAGDGVFGYITSAKGHVLADVVIRALEDSLWLDLPRETGPAMEEHLGRFIVADDVNLRQAPDLKGLTLTGPGSRALLGSLMASNDLPASPWGHRTSSWLGGQVRVGREMRSPEPAWTLWTVADEMATLQAALMDRAGAQSAVPVGERAREILRVRSGLPRFGVDFGPDNLPQEVSVRGAIDFEKGCYLGQEVVARLHFRGQAARWLCGIRIASGQAAAPGMALSVEGREVGRITSSAQVPGEPGVWGIAMLGRRAAEGPAMVESAAGEPVQVFEIVADYGRQA